MTMANAATERRALDRGEPHGVPHQRNLLVLDVDSHITNYGRHNKLAVGLGTGDDAGTIMVREDLIDLPLTTDEDRRRMIRHDWPEIRRYEHVSSEPYESNYPTRGSESIEHTYRIVR